MEVEGQVVTMATGDFGSPGLQRYTKAGHAKGERRIELALRRQNMEDSLRRKIGELRALCLQEAELTGRLPMEYPLEPGEKPPLVIRRSGGVYRASEPSAQWGGARLRELERRFEMQQRAAVSAQGLGVSADGMRGRWMRRYGRSLQLRLGDPAVEFGPSSASGDMRGNGQTIGRGDGWTLLPTDIYHQARGRRNSYASPVRMLQRSVSGAGRRSEPCSPIVYRDRAGRHRPSLPIPCADGWDTPLESRSETGAERMSAAGGTRRSSSSEVLGGASRGGAGSSALRLAAGRWPERPPPPGPSARLSERDRDRELHRALALEGLRDWYVRAAGQHRRHHTTGADWPSISHRGPTFDWRTPEVLTQRPRVADHSRWC
ncbi:coiled-coil domain-containing protein 120-like [Mobula birostris]|uniref:coiled-coil domain-containing protein 120-like n=1 Tax=Mobula birostris TaxID=1983395 RepID=UPI003B280AD9